MVRGSPKSPPPFDKCDSFKNINLTVAKELDQNNEPNLFEGAVRVMRPENVDAPAKIKVTKYNRLPLFSAVPASLKWE